jgi:hypothetical protein
MDGWMDGWMDGCMDGWMDGRTDLVRVAMRAMSPSRHMAATGCCHGGVVSSAALSWTLPRLQPRST